MCANEILAALGRRLRREGQPQISGWIERLALPEALGGICNDKLVAGAQLEGGWVKHGRVSGT